MRLVSLLAGLAVASVVGCGGDDDGPGGGTDGGGTDSATTCSTDTDCDDGVFCNGAETCAPLDAAADANGCVAAVDPACLAGQTCDEDGDACQTECEVSGDADGDGVDSTDCGGTDCDDADPNRFPGNAEICDADDRDEDCDPRTFGFRDADMDSVPDALCCNIDEMGASVCGLDCDDMNPAASPTSVEACDRIDNDCDGTTDEGVTITFFRDMDDDGRGVMTDTMEACEPPMGYAVLPGDCDDMDARRSPGLVEMCDAAMIDEDCDGMANVGCDCSGTMSRSCAAAGLMGPCASGTQTCLGGMWGACSRAPTPEICNGIDDDCNGMPDDAGGFVCVGTTSRSCTTACTTTGSQACMPDCSGYASCAAALETCNYCDDNLTGNFADERPLATVTQRITMGPPRTNYGAADNLGLYSGTTLNSVGASYVGTSTTPRQIILGFGQVTLTARVTALSVGGDDFPDRGWSTVIFTTAGRFITPSSGFLGAAANLGVPQARNGWAIEWWWNRNLSDRLNVRQLRLIGSNPIIRSTTTLSPHFNNRTGVDQQVDIRITPDIPSTPSNEMAFQVLQNGRSVYSCNGSACAQQFSVGQAIYFGQTGANGDRLGRRTIAVAGVQTTWVQPESCP